MPIDQTVTYDASTDVNSLLGRPGQYTAKASFHDSRLDEASDPKELGVDDGGSIETFASQDDAQRRYDYVDRITKGAAIFAEYHYLEDGVFLRLSKSLTPDQAAEYEIALKAMLGK